MLPPQAPTSIDEAAQPRPHDPAPLIATDVTVVIDGKTIIEAVTCSFARGTVTGILGPNGAGKTTFLRALADTVTLASGSVTVHGVPVSSLSRRSLARFVGVIPQHTQFTLELSVREIVRMGRFAHRPIYASVRPSDEDVIDRSIKTMRLGDLSERQAYTLSGGERQRMFLAQLLAQEPEIILLDEPTTHLDIKYQGEILRTICDLVRARDWTAVVVLHDLNLAYRFCDRLLVMKDGHAIASGDATRLANPDLVREAFGVEAAFTEHKGRPQVTFAL